MESRDTFAYHAGAAVFASMKSRGTIARRAKTHELQEATVMLLVREAGERRVVAEVAVAVRGAEERRSDEPRLTA
jgi:hypothetical protein